MFIAIDESLEGRFHVIGSLWLPEDQIPELEAHAAELRLKTGMWGEVKWTNIDKAHLERYKEFLDLFFDKQSAWFNCIILDIEALDYKSFFKGNREEAYFGFGYRLIHHNAEKMYRAVSRQPLYVVFDAQKLEDKTRYNTLRKRLERNGHAVTRCCNGHSHLSSALQIADLLTGAVSAVWNGRAGSAQDRDLVGYIENKIGQLLREENGLTGFGVNKAHRWLFRSSVSV